MKSSRFLVAVVAFAALGLSGGCSSDDEKEVLTVIVNGIDAESGSVWESGEVYADVAAVGDTRGTNKGIRGFVSFDLTAIPLGAEIDAAALNLSTYSIRPGELDPFLAPNVLGSFQVHAQNYGALDSADYNGPTYAALYDSALGGSALGSIDARAALAGALASGYRRFQVRMQFATHSNGDGLAQLARFDDNAARLTVHYR